MSTQGAAGWCATDPQGSPVLNWRYSYRFDQSAPLSGEGLEANPMKVFVGTEFSDFGDAQLISCGLAAENGDELYFELKDGWCLADCSPFVRESVLPWLERSSATALTRAEAAPAMLTWLRSLGCRVTLMYDATIDWILVRGLLDDQVWDGISIDAKALSWPANAMARHFRDLLVQSLTKTGRHHSLDDARALRTAALQTETEFRESLTRRQGHVADREGLDR